MKNYIFKMATMMSSLALFAAIFANGARSHIIYCQPPVPKGLAKFQKK